MRGWAGDPSGTSLRWAPGRTGLAPIPRSVTLTFVKLSPEGRCLAAVGLLTVLIALLALAVRSLFFFEVFLPDGHVQINVVDGSQHARRALFSCANFPAVLYWDPYLAYPTGAPVPMPPLYDWLLGAIARAFDRSCGSLEHVAAWVGPVLSALTVFPVYAAGRIAGGRGVGLGAATIFALLPVSILRSSLGNPDHHAAVALLVSILVLLTLRATSPGLTGGRIVATSTARALATAALALTWSGSLLYIGLGEGVLLLAGALTGDRRRLMAQATTATTAAVLIAPWVAVSGTPIGGPFASTSLSWLHVVALCGVGLVAGALGAGEAWRPSRATAERLVRIFIVTTAGLGLFLSIPSVSSSVETALAFMGGADLWATGNSEQRPLVDWAAADLAGLVSPAHERYGYLAWLIPWAGIAALWRARQPAARVPMLCLAGWTLVLATLAILQRRYGSDFAPLAAIGFALILAVVASTLERTMPRLAASALALLIGVVLILPGARAAYLPYVPAATAALFASPQTPSSGFATPAHALTHFLQMVRRTTPETSGFFDPEQTPEYGILVNPSQGHAMAYVGRRPTPANNFGPYLDRDKYISVVRFFRATSEQQALAAIRDLGVRYVMTHDHRLLKPGRFDHLLHRHDGSRGETRASRMRLIIEGPEGADPLWTSFPPDQVPPGVIPYKLFEIVEGAVIESRAEPGTPMRAQLALLTSTRRRFTYTAATSAGDNGLARLRLPYATETREPTKPDGPYRVWIGNEEFSARMSDAEVRQGKRIPLRAASHR